MSAETASKDVHNKAGAAKWPNSLQPLQLPTTGLPARCGHQCQPAVRQPFHVRQNMPWGSEMFRNHIPSGNGAHEKSSVMVNEAISNSEGQGMDVHHCSPVCASNCTGAWAEMGPSRSGAGC